MAEPEDDEEIGYDEFAEAYEQHRAGIYEMLIDYADQHDLSDGFLAQLVADIGVSVRMVAYATETDNPSIGGLRIDLDRFSREIGDIVRDAKKGAAEFIAEAREQRRQEEAEAAEEDDEKEPPPH